MANTQHASFMVGGSIFNDTSSRSSANPLRNKYELMYKDRSARKSASLEKTDSVFIEDMKQRSSQIEKKLLENLEFLKVNSLEITKKLRKETDSDFSTQMENC
jgi:hypothetical protein